jgi:hypothetical protein
MGLVDVLAAMHCGRLALAMPCGHLCVSGLQTRQQDQVLLHRVLGQPPPSALGSVLQHSLYVCNWAMQAVYCWWGGLCG